MWTHAVVVFFFCFRFKLVYIDMIFLCLNIKPEWVFVANFHTWSDNGVDFMWSSWLFIKYRVEVLVYRDIRWCNLLRVNLRFFSRENVLDLAVFFVFRGVLSIIYGHVPCVFAIVWSCHVNLANCLKRIWTMRDDSDAWFSLFLEKGVFMFSLFCFVFKVVQANLM